MIGVTDGVGTVPHRTLMMFRASLMFRGCSVLLFRARVASVCPRRSAPQTEDVTADWEDLPLELDAPAEC